MSYATASASASAVEKPGAKPKYYVIHDSCVNFLSIYMTHGSPFVRYDICADWNDPYGRAICAQKPGAKTLSVDTTVAELTHVKTLDHLMKTFPRGVLLAHVPWSMLPIGLEKLDTLMREPFAFAKKYNFERKVCVRYVLTHTKPGEVCGTFRGILFDDGPITFRDGMCIDEKNGGRVLCRASADGKSVEIDLSVVDVTDEVNVSRLRTRFGERCTTNACGPWTGMQVRVSIPSSVAATVADTASASASASPKK